MNEKQMMELIRFQAEQFGIAMQALRLIKKNVHDVMKSEDAVTQALDEINAANEKFFESRN